MRCGWLASALVVALVASPAATSAEDERSSAPEVGAWVKYYIVSVDSGAQEWNNTLTIRYLDRVTENGETCRWIEFDGVPPRAPSADRPFIWKVLIPESRISTDANPIRHSLRLWVKADDMLPERLEVTAQVRAFEVADIFIGPYLTFLPATQQHASVVELPRTVEYQDGRLQCESACAGSHKAGYHSSVGDYRIDWTIDQTLWLHDQLRQGFASAKLKWTMRIIGDDGIVRETQLRNSQELWVLDFGTGAKSALPDCN